MESASTGANALDALCTWAGSSLDGIICTLDHPLLDDKEDVISEQENNPTMATSAMESFSEVIYYVVGSNFLMFVLEKLCFCSFRFRNPRSVCCLLRDPTPESTWPY